MRAGPSVGQRGTVSITFPLLLWLVTVASVVLLDLGAYLVAASRAQTIADNGALAAVSATVSTASRGGPRAEAAAVVHAAGGELVACRCPLGAPHAEVTVGVPVAGLVVPRFAADRVEATASAELTEPAGPRRTWGGFAG